MAYVYWIRLPEQSTVSEKGTKVLRLGKWQTSVKMLKAGIIKGNTMACKKKPGKK